MQCSIPYLVGILDMVNAGGVEMLTALTNDESVDPYIRESVLSTLP
ncbi:HEAT repeat [Nostoc flagelliforme CCNUN1]|uniref:HEAT repeat n=2 Tax=Nostoc flagelliforme TaxID=1306274 RepID=A0A2K8STH3_9NOSO|nr:HEAT repeat [Nostoc flagelliforme CCNUN1]